MPSEYGAHGSGVSAQCIKRALLGYKGTVGREARSQKMFGLLGQKGQPGEQLMADLPKERITPDKPPFTAVGVDYFGLLEVKQGRSRVKRYECIFTCLVLHAVHIEIAHSFDTDSMINALRRFISVRGRPEIIRSNCGMNFTSAESYEK